MGGGHFEELGLAETTHAPLSIGTPTWDPARGTLPPRENLPRELVSQNKFNNLLLFSLSLSHSLFFRYSLFLACDFWRGRGRVGKIISPRGSGAAALFS